ncbi:hypothetical protein INR49_021394 [Caranx melampygus]|nr:hypothetical protein INR49_021394 [Caranx melampygus]
MVQNGVMLMCVSTYRYLDEVRRVFVYREKLRPTRGTLRRPVSSLASYYGILSRIVVEYTGCPR